MRTISNEEIELFLEEIDTSNEKRIEELIHKMSHHQGFIMTYLLAVSKENFSEQESEDFFYIGFTIWYIMSHIKPTITTIEGDKIDAMDRNNFKMLDVMADETEEGISELIKIIVDNYNQAPLFGYVVEALMEEDEDGEPFFEPNHSGIMLIYLKTVIDCLDKA